MTLWDELTFALSAGLAQILTNLDNLAVLLALAVTIGVWRAAMGYILSQGVMLTASLAVALGADQVVPGWAGYLGVVPVLLGLRAIATTLRRATPDRGHEVSRTSGFVGTTALFLALSLDSFSVMAPLLADSSPTYRGWALAGAAAAVAIMCLMAHGLANRPMGSGHLARRLDRLGPVIMILVGLYVLVNTGTDVV